MPRTDEAFDTYSIPTDGAGVGGLAVFNDANGVIQDVQVGADEVTFIWDNSVALPQDSFSFTYRVVGANCDSDPDANCDTKTKLFEAGTVNFNRSGQAQPAVPMATTNFTPDPFPLEISSYSLVTGEPNAASPSTTFQVSLREQPSAQVTLALTSSNTVEGDVSAPGNTLTFDAGNFDNPQTVTLTGGNDNIDDGDEDYTLTVVASGDSPYDGATGIISVTNEDDDSAGFLVVNSTPTTSETGTTTQIAVKLTSEPEAPVAVTVILADTLEIDYASAATHTFDDTNWDTAFNFAFSGVDDDVDDGDQQVSVTFNVTSTDPNYSPLTIGDETITNVDDDTAGVSVTDSGDNSGEPRDDVDVTDILTSESGYVRNLWVRLRAQPPGTTTVNITLGGSDPNEASPSTGELTFTTGNWDTKQLVTITGADDNLDDGNATYTVDFAFSYSNVSGSVGVNGTNLDTEMAGLIITPQAGTVTDEQGGQAVLEVRLMGPPGDSVIVDITGVDASEGFLSTNQLTFTTGNWFQNQPVTVTGVDGADGVDGDVSYSLNFALTSNDANFDSRFNSSIVITNLDRDVDPDVADISFSPTWLDFGDVAVGESKTLHVTLSSIDPANVTYTIASDAAPFGADAAVAVTADGTGAVAVTFSPTVIGSQTGAITFTEGDSAGATVVGVIGNGVDSVDGIILINPTNVVAKPSNAVDSALEVTFDVELTVADLVQLDFDLTYPVGTLTIDAWSSPLTDLLVSDDGNGTLHFEYMDIGSGSIPTGSILSINATASTASIGAWPLGLTNVSTTPKDLALQVAGAQLAVSEDVKLGNLEVSGDGVYNFDDLVLIYRNHILPFNSSNSFLFPQLTATVTTALTPEEVEANVHAVRDSGLDVDLSGVVDFDDLVLIYRNTILPFNSSNSFLFPQLTATVSTSLTPEEVEANILKILP